MSIKYWDIKKTECVRTIENAHTDAINVLCKINPDTFASGGDDNAIIIWIFSTG